MRLGAAVLMLVLWGTPVMSDQRDPRLGALFDRLRTTDDASEAARVEQSIWQAWTAAGDEKLDALIRLLNDFEITELVRSGKMVMARGVATT